MILELSTSLKAVYIGLCEFLEIKLCGSVFAATMLYFLGAENLQLIYALIFLVTIDFVTGISSAKVRGEVISSRKAARSASKFVVYILFMAAAHLAEGIIPGTTYLENVIVTFLALTEFISVIENIGKMGFAIPKQLLNKLNQYHDQQ